MQRLLLIEGLPGTGKTTISKWLFDLLQSKGEYSISFFDEFDERVPSNFCNVAGIPKDIFYKLYPDESMFSDYICKTTENFIYIKMDRLPKNIKQKLKRWDIGDEFNTLFSLQEYVTCTLEWWQNWVQDNSHQSIIMDSAFLQNPINEMIFRKATDNEIKLYISAIADLLTPLKPICIYLQRSGALESIEFAKAVKGPEWAAGVEGLQQFGCADLFERRFKLEPELISNMQHLICEIQGSDWSIAKKEISKLLLK